MKNSKIVGTVTAVAVIYGAIAVLNTSSAASLWQWPVEAYQGMVFTIGWMTRAQDIVSYILAIVVFLLIAVIAYLLGSWAYRKVTRVD